MSSEFAWVAVALNGAPFCFIFAVLRTFFSCSKMSLFHLEISAPTRTEPHEALLDFLHCLQYLVAISTMKKIFSPPPPPQILRRHPPGPAPLLSPGRPPSWDFQSKPNPPSWHLGLLLPLPRAAKIENIRNVHQEHQVLADNLDGGNSALVIGL